MFQGVAVDAEWEADSSVIANFTSLPVLDTKANLEVYR